MRSRTKCKWLFGDYAIVPTSTGHKTALCDGIYRVQFDKQNFKISITQLHPVLYIDTNSRNRCTDSELYSALVKTEMVKNVIALCVPL